MGTSSAIVGRDADAGSTNFGVGGGCGGRATTGVIGRATGLRIAARYRRIHQNNNAAKIINVPTIPPTIPPIAPLDKPLDPDEVSVEVGEETLSWGV